MCNFFSTSRDSNLLGTAFCRALRVLDLKIEELPSFLHDIDCSQSEPLIDPKSKEGQATILIIQIYRNLNIFSGSDESFMSHFLRTENTAFSFSKPIDLMSSIDGLEKVKSYLEKFITR